MPLITMLLTFRLRLHETGAVRFHIDEIHYCSVRLNFVGLTRSHYHVGMTQFQTESLSQMNLTFT